MKNTVQIRTAKKKARQKAFIKTLYDIGILSRAAEAVGIGRQTVYDWKAADPDFALEMEDAIRRGIYDRLFQIAHDSRNRGSSSVLIFLAKTVLGLSDRHGASKELSRQLEDARREIERMRLVVYRAAKGDPELARAISSEIRKLENES